jgi:uncharacterized protein (DUF488 family)
MSATVFTIGYEKRTLAEYVDILSERRIDVLIDVRETAWSHKPGFSKVSLSRALAEVGIEYVHANFAGNPKWLRTEARDHAECLSWYALYIDDHYEIVEALDELLSDLIIAGKRVCLSCFERHPEDCHRSILAERWRLRGRRYVQHLATGGCARIIAT